MQRTDVLIIGAGQAGLAMSACLSVRGIDHVLIERGRVAERWRSDRWDSLRLLTPNWMTRLPGHAYQGDDPSGFMHRDEVTQFLEQYGHIIAAPIIDHMRVIRVAPFFSGYNVTTDRGEWFAQSVVIATGACDTPSVPTFARDLPGRIYQVVPEAYERAETLPDGPVLVVGGSATGVQLAEEIHRSGRPVTLAAGSHIRLPRAYRGRDIMDWMDAAGILNERSDEVRNLHAARRQPSLQLIGRKGISLDLPKLAGLGVSIIGRVRGVSGETVQLAPNLAAECAAAENRRHRVLSRIDAHIAETGTRAPDDPTAWTAPEIAPCDRTALHLRRTGIRTILWATGYARDYSWLDVPVCDAAGEIRHDGGVTPAPGLYALGLRLMKRRNSSFIDGVGRDAEELAATIAAYLGHAPAKAA